MGKLITEFTPITTPAPTRLMTLGDEITGERFELNITEFFASVQTNVQIDKQDARLDIRLTGDTDRSIRLTNGADGLTPSIQAFSNSNVPQDVISWNHASTGGSRVITFNGGGGNSEFLGSVSATKLNDFALFANRTGTNGNVAQFQFDGANVFIAHSVNGVTIATLAGTGSRQVFASAAGLLTAP